MRDMVRWPTIAFVVVVAAAPMLPLDVIASADVPPDSLDRAYVGWIRFSGEGEFQLFKARPPARLKGVPQNCISGSLPGRTAQARAALLYSGRRVVVMGTAIPYKQAPDVMYLANGDSVIHNWCLGETVLFASSIRLAIYRDVSE